MLRSSCFYGRPERAVRAGGQGCPRSTCRSLLFNQFRREEDRVELVLMLGEIT
jgi:hypothetical protein